MDQKPKDVAIRRASRAGPRIAIVRAAGATSSVIATYAGYIMGTVEWTGERPAEYSSSAGVLRRFCRKCSSPMSFEVERWPDEVHLFLPSFDAPEAFWPQ